MTAHDNIADIGTQWHTANMKLGSIACAIVTLVISSAICATSAMAEQLRFTGQTTANVVLIKDTLRQIQLVGQAQNNCGVISAVEASILPKNFQPSKAYRVGAGSVIYEAWSTMMCGNEIKFLISFWPAPDGGMMFAVGYPYPSDAP